MSYSNQQLKQLAQTNPQELIRIITNPHGNDIKTISQAIDVLGEEISDETLVLPLIRRSLKHVHVLIRESAIICASNFYTNKALPQDIVDKLKLISKNDPSANIRELAADTLKDFKYEV